MELTTRSANGPELTMDAQRLDSPSTLVMVFAAREALECSTVLEDVCSAYSSSVVVGCSTAGHFVSDLVEDDKPVLIATRFAHTGLRSALVPLVRQEDSTAAGEKLAAELTGPGLRAVLILSDGITCNGSALVEGLSRNLAGDVTIFGGLAADGDAFVDTKTVLGSAANSKQVVAVGLYGDRLIVRTGTRGGWHLFGPERTITESSGTVLSVLDGEPALDLYRRYLGDRAEELPGSALLFPLAIRSPEADAEHRVVRTVLGVDEETKTMTFAGDIPTGWRAQLMRASFDALVDGAEDAAAEISDMGDIDGQSLCLGVTCVGRRLVLGSRVEDELDAVADVLGERATLAGFYSYGEIAPGRSGRCELHNQTMTLTLLGER